MKPKMIEEVRQIVREELAGYEAGIDVRASAHDGIIHWDGEPYFNGVLSTYYEYTGRCEYPYDQVYDKGDGHIEYGSYHKPKWTLRHRRAMSDRPKPVTHVTYWDGMGDEKSYHSMGEPDIERIKRELRFGEMDGAWVIEVWYNKTKRQMKCSRVNDIGGTNIIDRINAHWTRTANELKVRAYETWRDDVWFIWADGYGISVKKDLAARLGIPICPKSVHKDNMRPPK